MDIFAEVTQFVELAYKRGQIAATTRKGWRWNLQTFATWAAAHGHDAPSSAAIVAYLDHVQTPKEQGGRGYKPYSTRAAWVALCAWDRFLIEEGRLPDSILPRRYKLPKIVEGDIVACPASEQRAIAAAAEALKLETPFRSALARACYFVLVTCAVRNNALRSLKLSHYDREAGTLRLVGGKNRKTSVKDLSQECIDALEAWLTHRPLDTRHDYLFCQQDRVRKLGDVGLKSLLRDLSLAAGLEWRREHRPHAQRRGTATRRVQEGDDLDSVRQLLDHSKLTTTQIYTRQPPAVLRASKDRFPLLAPKAEAPAVGAASGPNGSGPASAELAAMRDEVTLLREAVQALLQQQAEPAAPASSELAVLTQCLQMLLARGMVAPVDAPPPAVPPARPRNRFGRTGTGRNRTRTETHT